MVQDACCAKQIAVSESVVNVIVFKSKVVAVRMRKAALRQVNAWLVSGVGGLYEELHQDKRQ